MEPHQNLRRIFDLVLEAAPADRSALLSSECGGDHALRHRIEAMIAAAEGDVFLGEPTANVVLDPANQATIRTGQVAAGELREGAGTRIGSYKLLQLIGEDGFGSVFMAEQEKPVQRKVALKIIKLGMDTRAIIARFEAERQALAMMDHPHIARVLDVSATDTGRPYFVMDLVKGDPIAEYCDKNNLSIGDRLELFAQVCNAVQHAHTKGIIHRDIKPSNILVSTQDGRPHAKVIDFGIAKATASKLTEKTLFTEHRQLIGTPEYMSPEQAEGSLDIDTRTDVYSLGVLLYELLTGSTPFDAKRLRSVAYAEIQRIIREVDPPNPSTRLSQSSDTIASVAVRRHTEPKKLVTIIRGELDWIVMKAMEKDRARRYESANGLAADIHRYLSGEAVVAAPPSASYRARKFVRRHKVAVAAAASVALALSIGLAGTTYGLQKAVQARLDEAKARTIALDEAQRAREAEAQAKARAEELKQVSDFQAGMLDQIDPTKAGKELTDDVIAKFVVALNTANPPIPEAERAGRVETFKREWSRVNATDAARELIDRTILKPAIEAIDTQFKNQPVVDAQLRHALATRYQALGLYHAALPLQTSALATRRRVLGNEHRDTLTSMSEMGLLLQHQGRLAEAEPFRREALDTYRRVLGEEHRDTVVAIISMGSLLEAQGKLAEAEPFYREALEKSRRLLGEEHPNTLMVTNNLGTFLQAAGKFAEAEPYLRDALNKGRRTLGENHPGTLTLTNNLSAVLKAQGKLDEAEPYCREVLDKRRRVLGEDHPGTLVSITHLGSLLQERGKLAEAESLFREAMEKSRRVLGEEHPETLNAIGYMAALLQEQGQPAQMIELLVPAEAVARRAVTGGDAGRLALLLVHLGVARTATAKVPADFVDAEANLLEAHDIFVKIRGGSHTDTRDCIRALADFYAAWDKADPGKGHDAKSADWKARMPENKQER
ncbi:MAG: serine/threonine protein kinase [Phycisphaeraceae bacterium]|nr:serine/threonine protein kinase [Phycisphaeraceae bacterium]